ncbi:MAG: class I SAM-dependent methyltransferase [Gemmatimonadales bacterium]|nr:class I SAM-dependent methyltransferase [Gemmatimonadales bacterium]
MTSVVRKITACRLCDQTALREHVDFGEVPLGNNLRETVEQARTAAAYPLNLMRCSGCGHFQLGYAVDPALMYATNYTYLSGIGSSFVEHLESYADWVEAHCDLPPDAVIVDVGSNDGTALKPFAAKGFTVCGVDPASLAARIANENGVETINAFFDADAVAEIKRRHGQADYVTSHNVLAHVDDLAAVFRNVHDLLKDGGHFGFEIGYFREVLRTGCFDTIYHEHLDYHHAAPLVRHLTTLGFDVLDLSVNSVQGGSLRLLSRKTGVGEVSGQAQVFLEAEQSSVLYDEPFLFSWRKMIEDTMGAFRLALRERSDRGALIAGYGAPTKATLLMKMAEIGGGEIAYVVEDNAYKTGRFFPGTGVAIRPTAELDDNPPDVLVLFAWNFADDIVAKLKGRFDRPVEVVVPLPKFEIINL